MKKKTVKTAAVGRKTSGVGMPPALAVNTVQIEDLLGLMSRLGVSELQWEKGGERISLKTHLTREVHAVPPQPMAYVTQGLGAPVGAAPGLNGVAGATPGVGHPAAAVLKANQKTVLSPFVGTFYAAPGPGAAPFVREGQSVKVGETLCIVEAMKLMNEIQSEVGGKIVSVLAQNGQPVEYDEPLFVVET